MLKKRKSKYDIKREIAKLEHKKTLLEIDHEEIEEVNTPDTKVIWFEIYDKKKKR